MIRTLLLRGMLAGLLAGLLAFAFAHSAGELQVERAIAFEASVAHAQNDAPEPEPVSRRMQRGLGLLTGTAVYSSALGGIFGLVFAFCQGRFRVSSPRALALWIAALGFVAVVLVPSLKYPASPPSVGNPQTIGTRTAAYFLAIAISVAGMALSLQVGRRLARRFGVWNGALLACLLFLGIAAVLCRFLPSIDEVPAGFPATLLWKFRIASLGMHLLLWSTLGLLFGWWTERDARMRSLRA
jgi:predicted cobalt transporter CbtA